MFKYDPTVPTSLRAFSTLFVLASFLILSGCDDPSNVGQGLLDAQSGDTEVAPLLPTVSAVDRSDLTGGNAASGAVRALMGKVDDPVRGAISSRGVVDFVPASQFSTGFLNGTVSWAELSLNVDYRYGDTTGVILFDLYEIPADWQSADTEAGTAIAFGDVIGSYEVPVREGLARFELPSSWITEYNSTLRDDSFSELFHGFGMVPTDGEAVVGFRFSESTMRASAVPGDTASYALSKVASLTSMPAADASPGTIFLGDGSASNVDIRFPLDGDDLGESLIHRVILNLRAPNIEASYPAGFVRPLPTVLGMDAVSADGDTRLQIAEVAINAQGEFIMDNTTLTNVFQSANLGKSVLDRFELYFPPEQSGIGFFALDLDGQTAPIEALITATSID